MASEEANVEPVPEEPQSKNVEESKKFKESGNVKFGNGSFLEAAEDYTKAIEFCPDQPDSDQAIRCYLSQVYSNRAAAYIKLAEKEHYESAIADCSKALELSPENYKALYRRAHLYELTENFDDALKDYQSLLEKGQNIPSAKEACERLPRQIEERNEKMKTEMLGKLKELGNVILKPFGLSTNNFKLEQQDSGGYSVKFDPNAGKNGK